MTTEELTATAPGEVAPDQTRTRQLPAVRLPRLRPARSARGGPDRATSAGGSGMPPVKLLNVPPAAVLTPRVKDTRYWVGVAWLTISALVLGFLLHVVVISGLQHQRAQTLGYDELRDSLAKSETPVSQIDFTDNPVAAGTPLALLEIPKLGLRQVIVEGTTAETLREAPGHRRDSVLPGQAGTSVILGRQTTYGGPFGTLSRLQPGDVIRVTTGQGVNTFEVFGLRRAGDPQPAAPSRGEGRLELVTADGPALFLTGALHLDAALVSDTQDTPGRIFTETALPPEERALGVDSSGWAVVIVYLMLMVAAAVGTRWAWRHLGRWQTWLAGAPVLLIVGMGTADAIVNIMPNLI
ncbi:sortase [Salinibacterium sp. ZJ450]|uniref:sortase n=1 Tax=Salinibacterium sp. ZJ450 TaxID=2708338 RepID=UPI001423C836|nr:sortase [Salinibacterium sp. ZJ450]